MATQNATSSRPQLDAAGDVPDVRDRMYEPALVPVPSEIKINRTLLNIRNQGQEGACTGFSLGAAIDFLNASQNRKNIKVSVRMLYEMARRFDEWTGEDYDGSSLRGAIRGWFNNGVCEEKLWKYEVDPKEGHGLTVKRARNALENPLGAYYRLRPILSDYHTALAETGVICASARVHDGWFESLGRDKEIIQKPVIDGGHAFVIVGYNNEGFWIQNSWGKTWGDRGVALWTYDDWAENVMDAWVFRLAVRTPHVFYQVGKFSGSNATSLEQVSKHPRRGEIAGHFVHIDDGDFHDKGRYCSDRGDVEETARLLAQSDKYQHLLLFAHGGLNSPKSSAKRIFRLKEVFKANGIYPYHFMYDTGLGEELKDVIFNRSDESGERVGGFTDFTDRIIETLVRRLGTLVWEEMKNGAQSAFEPGRAGAETLEIFGRELANSNLKVHLIGHSTGAILHGHLLNALDSVSQWNLEIGSCSLLAPACTVDFFRQNYSTRIGGQKRPSRLPGVNMYSLTDKLEQDDTVTPLYRKSLLYMVSNAFERMKEKPLAGMKKFHSRLSGIQRLKIHYSNEGSPVHTRSETHGGFDNDLTTMNDLLKKILKGPVIEPFKEKHMKD